MLGAAGLIDVLRRQTELSEIRKTYRMAPGKRRIHIKESNYCFDNRLPVKTWFPCSAMGID
jgi:hypothetical protein